MKVLVFLSLAEVQNGGSYKASLLRNSGSVVENRQNRLVKTNWLNYTVCVVLPDMITRYETYFYSTQRTAS